MAAGTGSDDNGRVRRAVAGVAALVSLAACRRDPHPNPTDASVSPEPSASSDRAAAIQRALRGGDASTVAPLLPDWGAKAYACTADSDCVISRWVDGRCCDAGCDPEHAVSRDFEQALERQRAACNENLCPSRICMPPRVRRVARCVDERCKVETRKLDGGILKRADAAPCACAPGDPLCQCD
jgi:hypothetical protein